METAPSLPLVLYFVTRASQVSCSVLSQGAEGESVFLSSVPSALENQKVINTSEHNIRRPSDRMP